jgi:hypothetical protein
MRAQITRVYGWLAVLWAALVIVQIFLAGLGIFGAESFDAHIGFGNVLHALTALILLLAIAGPRTKRDIGMSAALFILVTIQIGLVGARDDAPGLAALHPVLALFAMGLAAHIGLHVLRPRRQGFAHQQA